MLEAQVRSDGDYGVTIGDNANSNSPRPMAVEVVTCENGAIEESAIEPRLQRGAGELQAVSDEPDEVLRSGTGHDRTGGPVERTGGLRLHGGLCQRTIGGTYSEVNAPPTHGPVPTERRRS